MIRFLTPHYPMYGSKSKMAIAIAMLATAMAAWSDVVQDNPDSEFWIYAPLTVEQLSEHVQKAVRPFGYRAATPSSVQFGIYTILLERDFDRLINVSGFNSCAHVSIFTHSRLTTPIESRREARRLRVALLSRLRNEVAGLEILERDDRSSLCVSTS